jgi:nitroreductase
MVAARTRQDASAPAPAAPVSGEAFLNFLLSRRSIGRVLPQRPPRQVIEQLLAAACAAPNHHLTRPWRFVVLAGKAREEIGRHLEAALRARLPDPASPTSVALLAKERTKLLRAPVILVVAAHPSPDPRILEVEEVAAGAAAVENVLLAAQALGLGAMWRTGETAYDPAVNAALGLDPGDAIVGFVYLGYPDPAQPPPARGPRAPFEDLTRWVGWEDETEG